MNARRSQRGAGARSCKAVLLEPASGRGGRKALPLLPHDEPAPSAAARSGPIRRWHDRACRTKSNSPAHPNAFACANAASGGPGNARFRSGAAGSRHSKKLGIVMATRPHAPLSPIRHRPCATAAPVGQAKRPIRPGTAGFGSWPYSLLKAPKRANRHLSAGEKYTRYSLTLSRGGAAR